MDYDLELVVYYLDALKLLWLELEDMRRGVVEGAVRKSDGVVGERCRQEDWVVWGEWKGVKQALLAVFALVVEPYSWVGEMHLAGAGGNVTLLNQDRFYIEICEMVEQRFGGA